MALTDTFIRNLKPLKKPCKYFDGGGLHIYVSHTGSKLWRLSYRFAGKGKLLSFGAYPVLSLKEARKKREEAKRLVAQGIDPSVWKRQKKAERLQSQRDTVTHIAMEWYEVKTVHLSKNYRSKILSRLMRHAFPSIGMIPIAELEIADLLGVLTPLVKKGHIATAKALLQNIGRICRYALLTGRTGHNVSTALQDALPTVHTQHLATIVDTAQVGELMRRLDSYQGYFPLSCALRLAPLVFTRPSELLGARWEDIDKKAHEWRIPAKYMKMSRPHIVPLSNQALAILAELEAVTGGNTYLFPSKRNPTKPVKSVRLLMALRSLGYHKGEMCPHGFRSMASTLLNELGYPGDWIERQLSHCPKDNVRASYNYAQYLPERRRMMQDWSDYLIDLKFGKETVRKNM